MSAITFRPARRANVPLLIGIAGSTGSGKTMSALRVATGLANGERFGLLDTENGRALHYADQFDFDHAELAAPFRPERYAEAIIAAAQSYPVIVVDSFSHEYAGDGGILDWHEEELDRMAGQDWKKREALTFAAWVKPKMAHKALVTKLLQLRAHLVVCLRAEERIEIVKDKDGKTKVVPKRTGAGHVGWIPVTERSFPYELTTSLVVTAEAPGVPQAIKLQDQHKPFVPLDQPLSEETGRLLGEWARGSSVPAADVAGLTYQEFRERLAFYKIPPGTVAAVGGGLFPGRSAGSLTDQERADLMRELLQVSAPPPEHDPPGAGSGGDDEGAGAGVAASPAATAQVDA